MTLQKTKKKYYYVQNLFCNTRPNCVRIYKYKKPKIYRAVTYSAAILLMTECYTRGNSCFFFIKRNLLNIDYFKEESDWLYIIRLAKSKYWWNRRVRMFFFFNNFRLISYIASFDSLMATKVFTSYNFFFNMIHQKNVCLKVYNLYKRVHLMEFLLKIYYPFEVSYFNTLTNEKNILFDSFYFYYYPSLYLDKSIVYHENFVEYFPLKNKFFVNNFYSYFYKNSTIYFSVNSKDQFMYAKFSDLNQKYFLVHKYFTINDKIYIKDSNLVSKVPPFYICSKIYNKNYYYYVYKSLILLIYFCNFNENNKFF